MRQSLDYALREARPYAIDFRIIRPDGVERNIHERGDIIFDAKTHKPLKLVGSVQDVTDRVQAEIQLHNANQELAEKVQELEQRSKEINLLSEMGSRLQTCKDAEEAFVEIGNAAEQLFPKWSGARVHHQRFQNRGGNGFRLGNGRRRRARFCPGRLLGAAPRPAAIVPARRKGRRLAATSIRRK